MIGLSERLAAGLNLFAHESNVQYYRLRTRIRDGKHRFDPIILLIHIPKCAGVSLRDALNAEVLPHKLFCDFAEERVSSARRIAVCTRDPFDRAISMYHYLERISREHPVVHAAMGLPRASDFTRFVQSREFEQLEAHNYFFRSQFAYVKGVERYAAKAVHLRFDHLGEDFKTHFGRDIPRLNATRRDDETGFDTPENRDRVRSVYRADYDLLPDLLSELRG